MSEQFICPSCCLFAVASRILQIGDRQQSFDTVGKFVDRVGAHSLCLLAHNLSLFNRIDAVNIGDQSDVMYEPSHTYTSHGYRLISLTPVCSGGVKFRASELQSRVACSAFFQTFRTGSSSYPCVSYPLV